MIISGIYTITNTLDGKMYVGYTKNWAKRKTHHKWQLRENKHGNPYLQKAWNKHGEENFEFELIEECQEFLLHALEHYWATILDTHNPKYGYNDLPTNPDGFNTRFSAAAILKMSMSQKNKFVSEETRTKIRIARARQTFSAETREKFSILMKNRIHTKERNEKISKKNRGVKKSQEHKAKISETRKILNLGFPIDGMLKAAEVNRKIVVQYDLEGNFIKEWNSTKHTEESGFTPSGVSAACRGEYKTHKDFIWKYKEQID